MNEKKKKYYAVFRGRKPGIYTTWFGEAGAEAQVRNFPRAIFKGFPSLEEARAFMARPKTAAAPRGIDGGDPGRETAPAPLDDRERIDVYTDGGALGNPGPGGYGVVILDPSGRRELSGGFRRTTNNRMELTACIAALKQFDAPTALRLHSDSSYVVNGIEKGWAIKWRRNGWMRGADAPAENADRWSELLSLCEFHDVRFVWVRGHAGNVENERCDRLAVAAAQQRNLPPDLPYETGETRKAVPNAGNRRQVTPGPSRSSGS
jgi:ribonuclease HI